MTSVDRRFGYNSEVAIKGPCVAATTANITLSGTQTIDGVSVVADDRVLVKDQSTASENGIYVVSANAWERAIDFNGNTEVKKGTLVYVHSGTVNTGTFRVTTSDPITIGTTSIAISASPLGSTVSAFMATALDDTTAGAFVETLRGNLSTETVTADDDEVILRDTSATTGKRMTFSSFIDRILTVARTFTAVHVHQGAEVFSGTPSINLTGGQIKFPATQSASADVNTLDDYEEGTWTPSLLFGGGNTGMTYNTQLGYYTKIGNLVTAFANFQITAKGSSTGDATIAGLPFTIGSNSVSVSGRYRFLSFSGMIQAYANGSSTVINLQEIIEAGTTANLNDTDFSATTSMLLTISYQV